MEKTGVREFEDARWKARGQTAEFRHAAAAGMIAASDTVLDIGCGDGLLMSLLSKKGAIPSGVDISEEGVKKCREKGFEAVLSDASLSRLPFPDKSFDIVVMLDILEHVYNPETVLKEAIRLAKRSVIVGVPNFNSFPARIQVFFGNVPENNLPHKGHIYWFNERVLRKVIRKNRLTIGEIRSNTFRENIPIVGVLMKGLLRAFPSLFALSFVVRADISDGA